MIEDAQKPLAVADDPAADPREKRARCMLPDKLPKTGTVLKLILTGLCAWGKDKLYYF
jgi:hypothetical protein